MADIVETTKVEEETPVKEVTKEVPAVEPAAPSDEKEKADKPAEEPVKEAENGTAAVVEEVTNGKGANGSTNGVDSKETPEIVDEVEAEESLKRKSDGVEVADAKDGVSAEKKAKLEEKADAEDGVEAPANGSSEAEVTA